MKGLKYKWTGLVQRDDELIKSWEQELKVDLEEGENLEDYKKKHPFEKWKQSLIDTNEYEEIEDVTEDFLKTICNKYVETRGEHYIVEDNNEIHYLELDDEYENVNQTNYKKLLINGEDTIFKNYKDLYKNIVEYNIYEDLQDSNYGYTLYNFYLSKEELEKLGIDLHQLFRYDGKIKCRDNQEEEENEQD